MEQRKQTAENPEKAETYIPLARKYAIVQLLAPGCIERTESGFWRENIIGRALVEEYILQGFCLHKIDNSGLDQEKPEFQFTLEDYDKLHEGRPNNHDFFVMLNLLDKEVAAQLAEKNDPFNRFQEVLRLGLTPEVVQELQKAVDAASSVTADAVPPSPKGEGLGEDEQK